jgi:hypothetical protein
MADRFGHADQGGMFLDIPVEVRRWLMINFALASLALFGSRGGLDSRGGSAAQNLDQR